MNLTQMLVTQKNVDQISAQFGLSEEQTLEAMAAIIPAFSEGLKRQTQNPQGLAGLVQALAGGQHAQYVTDPSTAMTSAGIADGNAILGHLFGNKDVSRGVASHAAASTGIGASILKSMLPVIASMVMGSLFKGSSRGGGGGGLLGQIIKGVAGGMFGGGAAAQPQRRSRLPSGRQAPGSLEDLLGQVLGGGGRQQAPSPIPRSRQRTSPRAQRRQAPGGGLGGLLEEMLGGAPSGRQSRQRRTQDPVMPSPRQRRRQRQVQPRQQNGGLGDIFGEMLEPGGSTSRQYQRETGSIFDEFLKG